MAAPLKRTWIGENEVYVPVLSRWVRPGVVVTTHEELNHPYFVTAAEAKPHAERLAAARKRIEAEDEAPAAAPEPVVPEDDGDDHDAADHAEEN